MPVAATKFREYFILIVFFEAKLLAIPDYKIF